MIFILFYLTVLLLIFLVGNVTLILFLQCSIIAWLGFIYIAVDVLWYTLLFSAFFFQFSLICDALICIYKMNLFKTVDFSP